jgi:putative heme-binding domain-containing protein
LLAAFESSSDATLGHAIVAALGKNSARASLAPALIKPRLAKFPQPVQAELETLFVGAGDELQKQRARLDQLAASLTGGDVRRGQAVFNSAKAACVMCHAMGYVGGKLGPDLTRVGQIRTERDLLEAIVFPSASFVRSYEPVSIRTKNGEELAGLLRSEAADGVVLATAPEAEARVARADIAEMQPGVISPMPPGYDQILTAQELADLIAFLRNAK